MRANPMSGSSSGEMATEDGFCCEFDPPSLEPGGLNVELKWLLQLGRFRCEETYQKLTSSG